MTGVSEGGATTSVLVADPRRLAAEALVVGLSTCAGIRPLPEPALTGNATVDVVNRLHPDVVLLDFWIAGDVDALTATKVIRSLEPPSQVLVLSSVIGASQVDAALSAGAAGFLPRSLSLDQVVEAVHRAYAGESPVFAEELRRAVQGSETRYRQYEQYGDRLTTLSAREIKILRARAKGRSVEEVAADLYLSPGTVRNHIQNILKKTGTRSQREAIKVARQAGLVPRPYAKEMGEHPGATPGLDDG